MLIEPKPHPVEFHRDVTVSRKREAALSQIAKDFEISEACSHNWLTGADNEDGIAQWATQKDVVELREEKKRIHLLKQEAKVTRRTVASPSRDVHPK
jgi:hypothetical protein